MYHKIKPAVNRKSVEELMAFIPPADGLGVVLTGDNDLIGIDLDKCWDDDYGDWSLLAQWVLRDLPNTYAERSPSGKGLRLFVTGRLDPLYKNSGTITIEGRECKLELYDRNYRFVTVTWDKLPGRPWAVAGGQKAVQDFQRLLGRKKVETVVLPDGTRDAIDLPSLPEPPRLRDKECLAVAFRARNGAKVRGLYQAEDKYWFAYPSCSERLRALAQLLAFYTGHDYAKLERLVGNSPLNARCEQVRNKWHSPRRDSTWGRVCICERAVLSCRRFYGQDDFRTDAKNPRETGGVSTLLVQREREDSQTRKLSPLSLAKSYADTALPPDARPAQKLLAAMRFLCDNSSDKTCHMGIRTLAPWLGVSHTAARKYLNRMVRSGLLAVVSPGIQSSRGDQATVYALTR